MITSKTRRSALPREEPPDTSSTLSYLQTTDRISSVFFRVFWMRMRRYTEDISPLNCCVEVIN